MGCHIITARAAILEKLPALGVKTAAELSLDAVKVFREDAVSVGPAVVLAATPEKVEACGPEEHFVFCDVHIARGRDLDKSRYARR